MKILTLDNVSLSLTQLPDEVDDIRFGVLDNTDNNYPDFIFQPLVFLESFNAPAMELKIGDTEILLPIDWSIIIGDSASGCDLEILPLSSLNDRGFEALVYNPLSGFRLEFEPIDILNFYMNTKWYFPKLRTNQALAFPLTDSKKPQCIYCIKEYTRANDTIKLERLL